MGNGPTGTSVLYETRGPVALITLNRPERPNSLDQPLLDALRTACDRAEDSIFGEPEPRVSAGIVVTILPWIVGPKRAKERAINRIYELMGMGEAQEAALDIDTLVEGEGMPTKRRFLEIARNEGLRAALAWREARASATE